MKNNTIALIDSKLSIRLSYKKMREEERALAENLEKRVLVLELCTNSLGAILGYKSFLDYNLVTLLLDARTKKEILYVFIKKYDPYYIWLPDFYGKIEGFNTIVYQKYGYYLLKSDECKGHELFNNLAVLLTTSGTTGSSQVVRLSYQNLYNNAEMIAKYMNLNYADKAITTMPLSYSYGLSIINSHFFVGASIVVTNKKIFQNDFWDIFKRERVTNFGGVPKLYEMLEKIGFLNDPLPTLKIMTQAGGRLSRNLQERFGAYAKKHNKKFIIMYGQTEATARIAYLPPEKCLEKIGSIGHSIPGGKIELVDDGGKIIKEVNCIGEIVYFRK